MRSRPGVFSATARAIVRGAPVIFSRRGGEGGALQERALVPRALLSDAAR